MITNHLISTPLWADISLEQIRSITYPAVLCSTIYMADDIVQELFQTLLPEEQERAFRFRQTDDRLRFVVGRALLRKLLGSYTKQGLENISFQHNAYGKPELAGYHHIPQFNLAHAGSYVAIGLDSQPVGIDIEYINPAFDFNSLLATNFSRKEIQYLQESPSPYTSFYLLWTRKEAFLKHIGCGLTKSPLHVPALPGPGTLPHFSAYKGPHHYHTYSCSLTAPDHLLSICLRNPDNTPPVFYELQLS